MALGFEVLDSSEMRGTDARRGRPDARRPGAFHREPPLASGRAEASGRSSEEAAKRIQGDGPEA